MILITNKITEEKLIKLFTECKEDRSLTGFQDQIKDRIIEYQKIGPVISVEEDGVPLGIGGVSLMHKGVATVWIVIGKGFLKKPILLVKSCKNLINEAILGMDLHRVQMDIDTDFCENLKFAKILGFKFEGRMIKYGPMKQDYDRYVLLR